MEQSSFYYKNYIYKSISLRFDWNINFCRTQLCRYILFASKVIYCLREIDYFTFASPSNSQRGWKKNRRPFAAPSRVRERVRKTTIRRKGSVAVRYLTCADDLMDFQMEKYTIIHAVIKQAASSHRRTPGSSMPLLICRTLLLSKQVIFF